MNLKPLVGVAGDGETLPGDGSNEDNIVLLANLLDKAENLGHENK